MKTRLASLRASQKVRVLVARMDGRDLETLARMIETGALRPVVDRVVPLKHIADALTKVGEGHVAGKIVIGVSRV